jgi:hypothetical protein
VVLGKRFGSSHRHFLPGHAADHDPGYRHESAAIVVGSITTPGSHTVVTDLAWGFGAIMFGQGASAVGISMANPLVLVISESLGSFP